MVKKRLNNIDVLRVLAMFTVMVVHYTRSLEYAGVGFVNKILPDNFFNVYLGGFGVAIFFVLSGASLMYNYGDKDKKFDLWNFTKKRFLGIYPMYYMAWLLAFLYMFYKFQGISFVAQVPKWKIILTVLGMDGYSNWFGTNFYLLGEWFLGCLLFLYILFPIIRYGIVKKPVITAAVIILVYFAGNFIYHGTIPNENFFLLRVPEFAFGMYFVYYDPKIKWPVALGTGIILVVMAVFDLQFIPTLYRNTVIGITVFVFVTYVCYFIKWEPFYAVARTIGKYAYAVFLTHHIIVQELCYHFTGKTFGRLENYVMFVLYLVVVAAATKALYMLNNSVVKILKPIMFKENK